VKTNISPRAPLSSPNILLHVLQLIVTHAITFSENFGNVIIILEVDVDKGWLCFSPVVGAAEAREFCGYNIITVLSTVNALITMELMGLKSIAIYHIIFTRSRYFITVVGTLVKFERYRQSLLILSLYYTAPVNKHYTG